MKELSHVNLGYEGTAGETVTVTVTGDAPLVAYKLRGAGSVPFPASGTLQFQLVAGNNKLELEMDSKNETSDTFKVVVRSVENEANNECVHTWEYHGMPRGVDYDFSA